MKTSTSFTGGPTIPLATFAAGPGCVPTGDGGFVERALSSDVFLNGEGGVDALTGGQGPDLINGGDGDDRLDGGVSGDPVMPPRRA